MTQKEIHQHQREAHEKLLGILEQPTITTVQSHCEQLVEQGDYDEFENFVKSGTDFIVTKRRLQILRDIEERLEHKDTPIVVLKGAYGSGKTVLMDAIDDLFESSQTYGGETIGKYKYGDGSVDCFTLSLEDYTTPYEFLNYIIKSAAGSNLSTENVLAIFENRISQVSKHDLPEEARDKARAPSSVEDVVEVLIHLPPKEIVNTIERIGEKYRAKTGSYFCIYIDEFEQLAREMTEYGSEPFILRLVKRLMRNAINDSYDTGVPPYLLFVNTFTFERFREELNFERDDTERLDNVSYEISLNRQETVELFEQLYRLYSLPLLKDGSTKEWYRTLESASPNEANYTYPFTGEVLRYLIELVTTTKQEDEEIVEAFREYKRLLVTLFSLWDPTSDDRIDLEFVFKYGDEVRSQLQRDTDIIEWNRFPGVTVVTEKIESDFSSVSKLEYQAILKEVAKDATLSTVSVKYYERDRIEEIGSQLGIDLTEEELNELIEIASKVQYFKNSTTQGTAERLIISPSDLIGEATGEMSRPITEQIKEDVNRHNLLETSLISIWEDWAENEGQDVDTVGGELLEFDLEGSANYTKSVTIGFNKEQIPVDDTSNAFQFTLGFAPDEENEEIPIEVTAGEANGKGAYFYNSLRDHYQQEVEEHYKSDESGYKQFIERLDQAFVGFDPAEIYKLFLKFSLIKLQGKQLNDNVEDLSMAISTFFSVGTQIKNIMNSGSQLSKYAYQKLGYNGKSYSAGELLDLAYSIQNLHENSTLRYEERYNPKLDRLVWEPKNVSRNNMHPDEFAEFLTEHLFQEPWIDAANADLTDDYGDAIWVIEHLRGQLETLDESEDPKIRFEEACEYIYGTETVHGNGRVALYILLLVGEYNNEWILESNDSKPILKPKPGIEALRTRARRLTEKEIKKEFLKNAKKGNHDLDAISRLDDQLREIDEANSEELLKRIIDDADSDWEVDYEDVAQTLGTLAKSDVFDEQTCRYLTVLRGRLADDATTYLITPRVEDLVKNLTEAREVLEVQQDRDEYHRKLTSISKESESDITRINIATVDEVEEFVENEDWNTNLEEADTSTIVSEYLNDVTTSQEVYSNLETLRSSIVPETTDYENSDDLETVTEEKEQIVNRLDNICDSRTEELESNEDWVENLPRKIVSSQWLDKASNALIKCKKELAKDPEKIDPDVVSRQYGNWETAETKLKESFIEAEEEVAEQLSRYDLKIDTDELFTESSESLEQQFTSLDDTTFKQLLNRIQEIEDEGVDKLVRVIVQNKVITDLTVKE